MSVVGITGKNPEQKELIKVMLDKSVDLVIVQGSLGSGKTLVATACAVELHQQHRGVDNIIISRPMIPDEGEEIGFLPGTEEEKLEPYLGGFRCAAAEIDDITGHRFKVGNVMSGDVQSPTIAKALATIKGCSYSNSVMILDEAQDATLSQIKKFVGRAGRGSKVFVIGDVRQKSGNATGFEQLISYAAMYQRDFVKYVELITCERSRLAAFADQLGG
jgi:PhoH-like ATPase